MDSLTDGRLVADGHAIVAGPVGAVGGGHDGVVDGPDGVAVRAPRVHEAVALEAGQPEGWVKVLVSSKNTRLKV